MFVALSAVLAFRQYRDATRTQRAQWLLALFERFFETDRYREARRSGYHVEDEQKWADYLNFFEFIAYLEEQGHLTKGDVTVMFEYWLKQLDLPEVREYLRREGFEKLEAYLTSMETE